MMDDRKIKSNMCVVQHALRKINNNWSDPRAYLRFANEAMQNLRALLNIEYDFTVDIDDIDLRECMEDK